MIVYLTDGTQITADPAGTITADPDSVRGRSIADWAATLIAGGGLVGPQVDDLVGVRASWDDPDGLFYAIRDAARSHHLDILNVTQ